MTLRAALHSFLRDAVNVSVHDGRLPTRPMMPALVQSFISVTPIETHSGPDLLLERRVQIDAYANNDKDVDETATALMQTLDGYRGDMNGVEIGSIFLISDFDHQPEEIAGAPVRYRRSLDFAVSYQEVPLES
jgi:hypothetical protein